MKNNRVFKSVKKFVLLAGIVALSLCFMPQAFTQAPWASSPRSKESVRTKEWKNTQANESPAAGEDDAETKRPASLDFLRGQEWNTGDLVIESGSLVPAQNQ